jgi:hypothetical protein
LLEDFMRIGQHIHQVGNRRALVACHIGDAGLQQGLGHRQNALAAELAARAKMQRLNFGLKGAFGHFRVLA